VKPLIICSEPSTQSALERQLQRRRQTFVCVTPAQLAEGLGSRLAESDDGAGLLVLDAASQESVHGGAPRFSEAAFHQLVDACRQRHLPLLMLSDSRVFPGAAKHRYRETEAAAPLAAAGEQLLRRERYLAEQLEHHLILRTGPLIAPSGTNLLTHLLRSFRQGGPVPVAPEPRFCPTPVHDLARVISGIIDQLGCEAPCWGVYHYHSSDAASCYEFAEVVLAAAAQYWDVGGAHVQLQAVAGEPFGGIFPLLNCQRIRDTFGIQQLPWRRAIPELLKQIYEGETQ
jgi:dTDP-4-dehydrorhamnose reductase